MKRLLFIPPMALAIRRGDKTMTRRVYSGFLPPEDCIERSEPIVEAGKVHWLLDGKKATSDLDATTPAYQPGEIVGIAEPWFAQRRFNHLSGKKLAERRYKYEDFALHYLADGPKPWGFGRYRQARFLPDAFVRTKVRILEVRVERLQDISEEDAKAEGVTDECPFCDYPGDDAGQSRCPCTCGPNQMRGAFRDLWDSIHAKSRAAAIRGEAHPWESNPWVFVYRFELVLWAN